jgi:hypothetical protein
MTDYETLSVSLLCSIAQAISTQTELLNLFYLKWAGAADEDLRRLFEQHRAAQTAWVRQLARLDEIVRRNHPDRHNTEGNGTGGG